MISLSVLHKSAILHIYFNTGQEILGLCENRRVLFDNKTKDETKRAKQVGELLSLVNMVIAQNGEPYTDDIFVELKVSLFIIFIEFLAVSH